MKTKWFKSGLTLLLLAVFITGSTLLLNGSITKAQALEDGKVITASATSSPRASTADVLSSAVSSESSSAAEKTTPSTAPSFTVTKEKPYMVEPGEKDLTMDDAKTICAKALKDFKNVDLTNGTMEMYYGKGSVMVKRNIWECRFTSADGLGVYVCDIDSITGQVYNLSDYSQAYSPDALDKIDLGAPPVPEDEKAREALLKDERYTTVACNFIKSKFPDKTIASAVNMFNGSMGSGGATWVDICVAVELSDETGYMVKVGDNTLDVLSVEYYPNGVASFYSTH